MQATTNGYRIAWALLLLLAVANIAGYAFDLYRAFWWFDRVLHAFTILAITLWLAVIVLAPALRAGPPHPLLAFLIVDIGVAGLAAMRCLRSREAIAPTHGTRACPPERIASGWNHPDA